MNTNTDRELTQAELEHVAGGVHEAKAGSCLGTNKSVLNDPPTK
jgi:hypothetical protein